MPLTLKITYWRGSVFALRQILNETPYTLRTNEPCLGHCSLWWPTANGSGYPVHEANWGCLHSPKLSIHTSASRRTEVASFGAQIALAQVYSQLFTSHASKHWTREFGIRLECTSSFLEICLKVMMQFLSAPLTHIFLCLYV